MRILVTGGSGLVGQALMKIIGKDLCNTDIYTFLSSNDGDLRDCYKVNMIFEKHNPDIVIHCASIVAGLYGNISNNYTMLVDNIKINTNVLDCCRKYKVRRLINILSTCVFGNNLSYPLTSNQILDFIPDKSNEGYSYSKRVLYTGSELLSKSTDIEVINLIPTNLYGKEDNYNLEKGHVLPSLMHKIYLSKQNNKSLIVKGDGSSLRQFVYANDFGRIILHFVKTELSKKFNSLIIGPPAQDELSIKELVNNLIAIFKFKGKVIYDEDFSNGQYKKTVSDKELLEYIPEFKFTSLNIGLNDSVDFFIENYKSIRK